MSSSSTPSADSGSALFLRPKPWGSYRRAVRIAADGNCVRTAMEDDVHHFRLTLHHDGKVVQKVEAEAIRTPWSICPGALEVLQALVGMTLEQVIALPSQQRAQQCMHLFDLAILAARYAGKSDFTRHYRIEGDYDQSPPIMRLWRDDVEMLSWSLVDGRISGAKYDGVPLNRLGDALTDAPDDEAEAALILRRASLIAAVRMLVLDKYVDADHVNPNAPAVCYARQPERTATAARNFGSSRDFHGLQLWPLL